MAKKFFMIIIYLINAVFFYSIRVDAEGALFPILQNEKWGYIDQTGKIVIEPQFGYAEEFSEGLAAVGAAVGMDGGCGYIDQTGKMVIEPRFNSCEDFSEGLAGISAWTGDHWQDGYINKHGEVVIKPQFDDARDFSEGLAYVAIEIDYPKTKEGYIDKTGKFVIQLEPGSGGDDFADFSEGLAPIIINEQYGYIDRTGKVVIEPNFDMVNSFSEGLANVGLRAPGVDVDVLNEGGYIDRTGEFTFEPRPFFYYPYFGYFSEGLAIAVDLSDSFDFSVDEFKDPMTPEALIQALRTGSNIDFPAPDKPIESLNKVLEHQELYRVMKEQPDDDEVKALISQLEQGQQLKSFELKGLNRLLINVNYPLETPRPELPRKIGFIDKTGKFIIEPRFDEAFPFSEGLAAVFIADPDSRPGVLVKGKWGYINQTGRFVIEPTFGYYDIVSLYGREYIGEFKNGLAKINIGIYQGVDTEGEWTTTQKWGYIDKTGRFVWQGEERTTYKK